MLKSTRYAWNTALPIGEKRLTGTLGTPDRQIAETHETEDQSDLSVSALRHIVVN
jgi:hypothetical protein